jgi:glycerophosphoryl diester phosphodiesterase
MIIAHRGSSKETPENTISAFKLAFLQGADGIEGDFHLTKDNQIVCIHDASTGRVSDRNLMVKDSTLTELKKLDIGSWFNPAFKDEKIPTLYEILAILPAQKKLFLEIKSEPQFTPHLQKVISQAEINPDQLVIISFNPDVLKEIKEKITDLKTLLLVKLQSSKNNSYLTPSEEELIKILSEIKANGLSSSAPDLLDKNYISQFISIDYEYHLWTIDDPERAKKFLDLGVNSITTNTPKLLVI